MKLNLITATVLVLLGVFGAAAVDRLLLRPMTSATSPVASTEMTYRRLANGTMVYEENPNGTPVEEIEPAAGTGVNGSETRYKYDPLTQTYRVQSVDRNGNKGQDIIIIPSE